MASNAKQPEGPAYMATFAVLMLLLLAFFVILNTFSVDQEAGFQRDIGEVREGFGSNLGLGFLPDKFAPNTPSSENGKNKAEPGHVGDKEFEKKNRSMASMGDDEKNTPEADVNTPVMFYRIRIPHQFEKGEHVITEDLAKYLGKVGIGISDVDKNILVRSYCEGNKELAVKRAAAIIRYLNTNINIPFSSMSFAGYSHNKFLQRKTEGEDKSREKEKQASWIYIMLPKKNT